MKDDSQEERSEFKCVGTPACRTDREKVISTREGKQRAKRSAHEAQLSVRHVRRQRERDTRIDDHPAVLDEPKDHAVAECHVVLETTGESQRQRIPETRRSEARHKQQTTLL